MTTLPTVALGLLVVFLDAGRSGWDWVADPLGWLLVLLGLAPLQSALAAHRALVTTAWLCLVLSVVTYPPDSVAALDETLGWLFSLPTLTFCVLLCRALAAASEDGAAQGFRWLQWTFVGAALLPLLLYGAGWDWLRIPVALLAVAANVVLVVALWSAGEEPEDESGFSAERVRKRRTGDV